MTPQFRREASARAIVERIHMRRHALEKIERELAELRELLAVRLAENVEKAKERDR